MRFSTAVILAFIAATSTTPVFAGRKLEHLNHAVGIATGAADLYSNLRGCVHLCVKGLPSQLTAPQS